MKIESERKPSRWPLLMTGCAAVLVFGGCPVDNDQLITDIVAAALESASLSLVDALSEYLAQN